MASRASPEGSRHTQRTRRRVVVVGVSSLALVVIFMGWFLFVRTPDTPQNRARQLIKSGDIVGWTPQELISEFGEPVDVTTFPGWDMAFDLGLTDTSYFGADDDWLVVQLDDAGTVVSADIITG